MKYPENVAANPKPTLAARYNKNGIHFCSVKRPMLSSVKAEKVVNPPQNPDISNNLNSGVKNWCRTDIP